MFYQNSAAREPPGPVPSLADGRCCTCVEVADRLPGISGQGLSISQEYSALLQEWIRVARIEHRSGMAYRMEIFHLLDLPSLEPGEFSQTRRVESASSRRNRE
jgi:hypothetical protein